MSSYQYDGSSSSSAPPPPYSVSAQDSGFLGPESTSSSLHPPPPGAHGTSATGAAWGKQSAPSGGFLDSKWRLADPRSSSAQSLAPSVADRTGDGRRTLLIVYIHGFYGNESSFRSFPAHVHNYLKEALSESHAVHSKIYPRYKTYKAIDVARDNFSQWLEPHESESTDVVLIGHSMGGILAGEVALMPNRHPYRRQQFKHRLVGTISLDSPFLGLHPGIVVAGISSLFRPASPQEESHNQLDASSAHLSPANSAVTSPGSSMYNLEATSSLGAELSAHASDSASMASSQGPPSQPDPFFNPPFWNDATFKERSFMKRLGHFAKKHSREGIWDATKNHVMSHLEYGGCLADYPGLNARYKKLRALEDVDPLQHLRDPASQANNPNRVPPARVRFVNYYTLSTGRPKKPKSPKSPQSPESPDHLAADIPSTLDVNAQLSPHGSSTPRISVENSEDGSMTEIMNSIEVVDAKLTTLHEEQQAKFDQESEKAGPSEKKDEPKEPKGKEKETLDGLELLDPMEMTDDHSKEVDGQEGTPIPSGDMPAEAELPPIPDLPEQPTPPDLDRYTDKDARKQAEKEGKRAQKAYEQAVKSRDKALKERQKLVEKRRKRAEKEALKEAQRLEKEEAKRRHEEEAAQKKQAEEKAQRKQEEEAQKQKELTEAPVAVPVETSAPAEAAPEAPRDPRTAPVPPLPPRPPLTATPSSAASIATTQAGAPTRAEDPGKPKKERKFCTLPRKTNGRPDETWVPIFMQDMDEVGAHCGLFLSGPHYDRLIGEVSERILGWVQDDMTTRAILEIP